MSRLGRRVQFDEKSRDYPVRALLTAAQAAKPRSYTWRNPIRLDQGNLGSCVGNAWAHELAAKPVPVPNITEAFAVAVYDRAQVLDGFQDTPPAEGTSVLAGAKAIMELNYLKSYRWGFSLDDLILAVGYKGPAILGIPWYRGMMDTDAKGYIHPTGPLEGGHAILCNRVSVKEEFFGLSNSWSSWWGARDTWGLGGTCRLSFTDTDRLLHEDGESCIPVMRSLP